jgi:hypothetical protein
MVLYDFRLFYDKICPVFHKNDPDPHQKSPKTQNILQIRPKNHQNRPTQKPPPPDFDDFWVEFAKYFVFLGIFDGDRGHFYEKMEKKSRKWTDFLLDVQKSRKSESTIAHCYLNCSQKSESTIAHCYLQSYFFSNQLSVITC